MSVTQSQRPGSSRARQVLAAIASLALAAGTVAAVAGPAAAVNPACGGAAQNGLTVTAQHDANFYVDLGNGFDTMYMGYRVANAGSDRPHLWVSVTDFSGTTNTVHLADVAQNTYPLDVVPTAGSDTAFFMAKATGTDANPSTQTVTVYDRDPSLTGATALATCDFAFGSVSSTIQAASNKVTTIAVSNLAPSIGQTTNITVNGKTGNANGAVWLSPVSSSAWPVGALRMLGDTVRVDVDGNGTWDQTYADTLYIPGAIASSYTASTVIDTVYTFQVIAPAAANPTVKPVAQISSGGAFKHTAGYPTLPTLSLTSAVSGTTVVKSVPSYTAPLPTTSSPNGVAGATTYVEMPYRITASAAGGSIVDALVDQLPVGAVFKNGSATVTDATPRTDAAVGDPSTSGSDPSVRSGALHFSGPFYATAGTPITLDYKAYLPLGTSPAMFRNVAYGLAGTSVLDSGAGTLSSVYVVTDGTATPVSHTAASVGSGLTAQTISFTQPADIGLGSGTRALAATATSTLTVSFTSLTPSVCTVSGTTATPVGLGTCLVVADQPGNATWAPAPLVLRSFAVTIGDQTISFAPQSALALDATRDLTDVSATSTLAVTLTSDTPGVCSITAGVVTPIAVGDCSITATQPGNATWNAAPSVTRVFAVVKAAQTISFTQPADMSYSDADQALTFSASSGLPVTLTSTTPSVCSVAGGTVTVLAAGTCSITASQDGDGTYAAAAPVTRTFGVALLAQTISFSTPADMDMLDGAQPLTYSASSGLPVTVTSATPLTCSTDGVSVSVLAAGTCTLHAVQAGDGNYDAASPVDVSLTISKVAQTIDIDALPDMLMTDAPQTLTYSASSGLPVALVSDTPAVCSTDGLTVTAVSAGHCSISGSQAGDGVYLAAPGVSIDFDIARADQTLTFAAPSDMTFGDAPQDLDASASSSLPVALTSLTPAVCDVVAGQVVVHQAGTCTLEANQAGDGSYDAAPPVDHSFTVAHAAQTIAFTTPSDMTRTDVPQPLTYSAGSGLPVTVVSDTPTVCTTDGTVVTQIATGTCILTATQDGDVRYAGAAPASVSFEVVLAGQSIDFPTPTDMAATDSAQALSFSASSGLDVTVTSTTSGVCTTDGTSVTVVAPGDCTLHAVQAGDDVYAPAADVDRTFTVHIVGQTISFTTPADMTYGDSAQTLAYSASSSLPVALTSATPDVCSSDGTSVTVLRSGTCTLLADQAGNVFYAPAPQASVSFQVAKADQTISFAQPVDVTVGDPEQTLTYSADSGLTVTITSDTPDVCTADAVLRAGTCTLRATQAGDDRFNAAADVTVSFQVAKADQTISFAQPTDMTYGDAAQDLAVSTSSALVATVTSDTPDVCDVVGGQVVAITAGTCTLRAVQAGDDGHNAAADVVLSLQVAKADQTISFATPADMNRADGDQSLTVSAGSGLDVTITSDTPAVCSTDGTSVTQLGVGTCTLRAVQAGDGRYHAAPDVTVSFEVVIRSQSITFGPLADRMLSAGDELLSPTSTSGLPVTVVSTTPDICSVVGGAVHVIADGTCTLVAGQPGDAATDPAPDVTVSFDVVDLPATADRAVPMLAGTSTTLSLPAYSPRATVTLTTPTGLTTSRSGTALLVAADANVTGVFLVGVSATYGALSSTGTITVTVRPQAPRAGTYTPTSSTRTALVWGFSPNTSVTGYRVYVNGVLRATTAATVRSVTLGTEFGPTAKVTVVALGRTGTLSAATRLAYKAPKVQPVVGKVYFASGSARLDAKAQVLLRSIALKIRSAGFTRLLLDGYTDTQGGAAYNKRLSAARVASVQAFLTRLLPRGIRVTPNGNGYLHPVASNTTAAGRALNRRVEITAY